MISFIEEFTLPLMDSRMYSIALTYLYITAITENKMLLQITLSLSHYEIG